ncbi:MAG: hypothetical protein M3R72_05745 [Bacteroidota bacterium]|nr:hypothetical protein [Bacteroidota bacterium]
MINFSELQVGDYVLAEFEGTMSESEVMNLNHDEKQICVQTEVQNFWFDPKNVFPIVLNDEQLMRLQFTKEVMDDGRIKYKKGTFRLVVPSEGNFSSLEMWYREDRRHHPNVHYIHQLQNQYLQMTKIHLTREVMV